MESKKQQPAWMTTAQQGNVQDEEAVSYPILAWINGTKQAKGTWMEHGGFFAGSDSGIAVDPSVGWEAVTIVDADNREIEGFGIGVLPVTPIRMRRAWSSGRGTGARTFNVADFDGAKWAANTRGERNPRGRAQILTMVAGIDGPIVLSLSGMQADYAANVRHGWANLMRRFLMAPASEAASRATGKAIRIPALAFRIRLGYRIGKDGAPWYESVGEEGASRMILPCTLRDPDRDVPEGKIGDYVVSPTERARNERIHAESSTWADQWGKLPIVGVPAAQREAPPEPWE